MVSDSLSPLRVEIMLDPKLEKRIRAEDSLYGMDWCPYEGMKIKGYPVITISKGRVIWEEGEFQGRAGDGEFLRRNLDLGLSNEPIA